MEQRCVCTGVRSCAVCRRDNTGNGLTGSSTPSISPWATSARRAAILCPECHTLYRVYSLGGPTLSSTTTSPESGCVAGEVQRGESLLPGTQQANCTYSTESPSRTSCYGRDFLLYGEEALRYFTSVVCDWAVLGHDASLDPSNRCTCDAWMKSRRAKPVGNRRAVMVFLGDHGGTRAHANDGSADEAECAPSSSNLPIDAASILIEACYPSAGRSSSRQPSAAGGCLGGGPQHTRTTTAATNNKEEEESDMPWAVVDDLRRDVVYRRDFVSVAEEVDLIRGLYRPEVEELRRSLGVIPSETEGEEEETVVGGREFGPVSSVGLSAQAVSSAVLSAGGMWKVSQSGRRKMDFGPQPNFKKRRAKLPAHFNGFPPFLWQLVLSKLVPLADRLCSVTPELSKPHTRESVSQPMNHTEATAASCTSVHEDSTQPTVESSPLPPYYPAEVSVLEYDPHRGASFDPHVDDYWIWGERIAGLSFMSPAFISYVPDPPTPMTATPPTKEQEGGAEEGNPRESSSVPAGWSAARCHKSSYPPELYNCIPLVVHIPLPRRSMFMMRGAARYSMMHGIAAPNVATTREDAAAVAVDAAGVSEGVVNAPAHDNASNAHGPSSPMDWLPLEGLGLERRNERRSDHKSAEPSTPVPAAPSGPPVTTTSASTSELDNSTLPSGKRGRSGGRASTTIDAGSSAPPSIVTTNQPQHPLNSNEEAARLLLGHYMTSKRISITVREFSEEFLVDRGDFCKTTEGIVNASRDRALSAQGKAAE